MTRTLKHIHRIAIGLSIAAPMACRAALPYDYGSDVVLAVVMIMWWALAWRDRNFPWYLWAATAGWITACAQSMAGPLWVLILFGLTPLYEAMERSANWKQAMGSGVIAGTVASVTAADWILHGFAHYTGWSTFAAIIFFIPFAFVALWQVSVWAILVFWLKRLRGPLWLGITPAAILTVADCIPLKPARTYLGYPLWPFKPLIQIVDITGMPGLTFLIGWFSYAAWISVRLFLETNADRRHASRTWSVLGITVASVLAYGVIRQDQVRKLEQTSTATELSVGAIQANAPPFVPNDAIELKTDLAKSLVRLGATAAGPGRNADLLVYAESAAPMGFRDNYNPIFREAYEVVARNSGAYLLVDNVGYTSGTSLQPEKFWRECLLLTPDGEIAAAYQKRKLVPVGESLPVGLQYAWLRKVFSIGTTFQAGTGPITLKVRDVELAPLVCVEALFDSLSREAARAGADILVSPSNDGWFRSSKEARQHLWGACFRAVETRLPLIRAANTGYSAAVTPAGDFLSPLSPLRKPWTHVWKIKLVPHFSMFSRVGHLFSGICGGLAVGALVVALRQKRRESQ